jgi:hypothetical protein
LKSARHRRQKFGDGASYVDTFSNLVTGKHTMRGGTVRCDRIFVP